MNPRKDSLQDLIDHYADLKDKHRRRERYWKTVLCPARTAQLRKAVGFRRRRRAA